ncbi:ROK family protein [Kiritimatiella glycovorans]|uniref:Transcriptional regulator n=1 Tax=Kiritimatiella glycovorans TaxID=1307763 RepID=A0A0G3EDY0_9BACT|nr:ROK family protein [Kiritimatiella glycovorans]AKJ64666.1 hypothetical protein L21SP4_01419 [Kiritimatiella glycovorans]
MSGRSRQQPAISPPLDPGFRPLSLAIAAAGPEAGENRRRCVRFAFLRRDGRCFHWNDRVPAGDDHETALHRLERTFKFLLWQKGAPEIHVSGSAALADHLGRLYSQNGARRFDAEMMGPTIYGTPFSIHPCDEKDLPRANQITSRTGGHFDGCRVGFDLGGSDRKCAAVRDGQVVHTEEVPWDPYFNDDPGYHIEGIRDSIRRAAAHLPRVDAIGGSAAGIYVANEPRLASLFRGIGSDDFERHIRPLFHNLQREWGHVPFEVINDGDVTALSAASTLGIHAVLGLAMGTSLAAGYCDAEGHVTSWLNELAFAPLDLRADGPVDEWSNDAGCGVQFLSQQAAARLALAAGFEHASDTPAAELLSALQDATEKQDARAEAVFESMGVYLGYALPLYAEFYPIRHVLLLGRVMSGRAGTLILRRAREVLENEFPARAERLTLHLPDERMKRHGQAIAAAGLPQTGPRDQGRA